MILVVDASAVAAMLFEEPEADTIRAHIRDESVIAPQLIDYELANICWKRVRRHPATQTESLAMLATVGLVSMTRVVVPPSEAARLAIRTGLTAYDAAYLWLAWSRDAELITLDRRLARVNAELRELPE
jgi:predicted nucleic acid-binding protein